MIMDKLKTALSKEHLMDATAVFAGYVIALAALEYLTPILAKIIPGESVTTDEVTVEPAFDRVISAIVVVLVIGLIPVKPKMLMLGATVVLINQIFLAMGIDILESMLTLVPPK